jgi:hypothetical protein
MKFICMQIVNKEDQYDFQLQTVARITTADLMKPDLVNISLLASMKCLSYYSSHPC